RPWQAPLSGLPGTSAQSDFEAARPLDRREWPAIVLNAPVNCLKEHEKETLLRRSITTATPFGSSFQGATTPSSGTGYGHRAFLRRSLKSTRSTQSRSRRVKH